MQVVPTVLDLQDVNVRPPPWPRSAANVHHRQRVPCARACASLTTIESRARLSMARAVATMARDGLAEHPCSSTCDQPPPKRADVEAYVVDWPPYPSYGDSCNKQNIPRTVPLIFIDPYVDKVFLPSSSQVQQRIRGGMR